jgi:hypothetical protein
MATPTATSEPPVRWLGRFALEARRATAQRSTTRDASDPMRSASGSPAFPKRLRALPTQSALRSGRPARHPLRATARIYTSRAPDIVDPAQRDHLKRTRPLIERLLALVVHR